MKKHLKNKPSDRLLRIVFRLSILLNMILIPVVFLKDHFLYYLHHSQNHDWITKPIMKSSLYKSLYQVDLTQPDKILKLYQLMKDVHEIFEKNKIMYWADSGTLLGAVRHRGIIPWDGDIDIGMRFEDGFLFQKMIPQFKKLGYEVDEAYFGFKIYLVENKEDRLHNVCCDVFMVAKDGDKYHYYSPGAYSHWPANILEKDMFPLKKYQFGKIEVWGPNTPEPYLTELYGNWKTLAYKGGEHFKSGDDKDFDYTPFTLEGKDFEPAQPTGPLKDRVG